MKANELMLNDWVYLSETGRYPMQITLLDEDGCYLNFVDNEGDPFEGDFGENGVQPVPLTKEMLFANGFNKYVSCRGKTYYGYTTDHKILFEIMEWVEGDLETAVGGRYIELKYVHELQHLLRLAGLDKVADEFKVKIDQPTQSQ